MNKKNLNTIASFILIFSLFMLTACEKDDPYGSFSDLNPDLWAPQNFEINEISITVKQLKWTFGEHDIEGFKIDRKKGDEPWHVAYQTFSKETRSWSDSEIIPGQSLTYTYRVYAYAGNFNSSWAESNFDAIFPPPENLDIIANSTTSITLSWDYNETGHDGFKIDRKENEGTWEEEFVTINDGQSIFTDEAVDLESKVYTYRIYSYYQSFTSAKEEIVATIKIGMSAFGGIVFYLDGNGGGLVCAENDQSTGIEWGCSGHIINGTSTDIGTGAVNTAIILSNCSDTETAPWICDELELNGYNDWFLPSKDELNLMYINLRQGGYISFANEHYWSSTATNASQAWLQYFGLGYQLEKYRYYTRHVRAARSFNIR